MYIGIEQDSEFCVIKNEKNFKQVRFCNKKQTYNRPQTPMNHNFQEDLKNLKKSVVFFKEFFSLDQLRPISGIKKQKNYAHF